ncbi:MAG: hypothetical protein OEZ43_06620 [Gammaproteobacteria bacterium]|nr:hypothetical protein [Gammaproteobacteria bacterium]
MIKLRPEQVKLFDELAERLFLKRMQEHLQIHFPEQCETLTEEQLKQRVSSIVEKARGYGIETRQDICDFVSLSAQFGDDFDQNHRHSWAREILGDKDISDGALRIARLNDEAAKRLDK